MNRKLSALALGCLIVIASAGCADRSQRKDGELRVLASTYPMFLFCRAIVAGEPNVGVEMMLNPEAGCPHDHQLTAQDMYRFKAADVFVINGLGLDDAMLTAAVKANSELKVINSSTGITDLIAADPAHQCSDHGHHHHHCEHNPHLFADPRTAAKVVRNIAAQLAEVHPPGRQRFAENAERYAADLEKLADEFAAAGARLSNRKIVTQHDAFAYLARTMGLEVVAVISDDPDQPLSASRKAALIEQIRSAGVAAIVAEPQYSAKEAESIAREPGVSAKVITLDPVATGPADPPGDYYFSRMRENLATLQQALGE